MSLITEESLVLNRRRFLRHACTMGLLSPFLLSSMSYAQPNETITPWDKATRYNNYFEFSDNKQAVAKLSEALTTTPWFIKCSGLIENPVSLNISELVPTQEYIYRFRCIEGWSMVVPWNGVSLARIIEKLRPKSSARFVKFTSLFRPKEMIGQRRSTLEWPYTEALRLDEAMHSLTILATGMYGKPLPNQNGAPVRLIVPWKYGFKSIKAITKIEFVETQPTSTWTLKSPGEYGFYANVNPDVPHPRWSQRRELRLGETKKRRTLPFNGYEKEVAYLYKGLDLKKNY